MTFFLCKLWPYLAGGLIGWLLAGWYARRLKHVEPPVEKIIEKEVEVVVDNPEHLALISKLKGENSKISSLMSTISESESADTSNTKVIEKEVEKLVEVDNPELLARIKKLEVENAQISSLKNQIKDLEKNKSSKSSGTGTTADNPDLLNRIKSLEEENAQISVLQNKIKDLENNGVGDATEVQKLVDNPKHIERISLLEQELNALKKGKKIDLKAARAAGISIKSENDLTAIEGIGPKINDLIHADGITTFHALADTSPETLQKTLDNAGSRYQMANPGTWPDQANLAANNRWPALKALQDVLVGGVYPDGSSSPSSKGKAGSNKKKDSASNKSKSKASSINSVKLDADAAKAAGFKLKQKNGQDDFTLIEGIGPKINDLIHAAGIHTFAELSETLVETIQKILDDAGPNYKLAKPGTWPAQSEMAATNRWEALKAWQDELDGGK